MVRGIFLGAVLGGLAAMPALACGVMLHADPKVGAAVVAPRQVSMTFTEAVVPASSGASITYKAGHHIQVKEPTASRDNTVLTLSVPPLKPDSYVVHWHVLWADCNSRTEGDYPFTVVKR